MEMVTITEKNLLVGVTVIEKKSNNKLLVTSIVEGGKYLLSNDKTYSFSTMKRNYKLLVEPTNVVEPVVEPLNENKVVKPSKGKKKLTDEQYVQIAEDFLKGMYKTKKEVAQKYNVDPATISDMFTKYCRKSCYEVIQNLKIKYSKGVK
ncbi:hypothetical protein [Clostridium perfringens]|uniref:hypothetical protein n=1 Tax=Clostridium perfringens TaxID=1502 RepID=UPI0032DB9123